MTSKVVIVGASHAGVALAAKLRELRHEGGIVLIGDEPHLPYQRPPLSKEFLKTGNADLLALKGEAFYGEAGIELTLGQSVVSVDRAAKTVTLGDGTAIGYDHLVLATGTRNRQLRVAGLDHSDVLQLRSLDHARALLARRPDLKHAAIIGGGFIGLECASYLRAHDIEVDVVEAGPRLMGRGVSAEMAEVYRLGHEANGVRLHLNRSIKSVKHGQDHCVLTLSDGTVLEADAVILAAGVVPNVELAEAAGLAVDNGIVVDENLATKDLDISAIGDCASYPSVYAGGMVRLESVQNAVDQAYCLAAQLTGEAKPYQGMPWFWTYQGDMKLQMIGLPRPDDVRVMRGDPASGRFSIFFYRGDTLVAAESLNEPRHHMLVRKLFSMGKGIPRALAADMSVELNPAQLMSQL